MKTSILLLILVLTSTILSQETGLEPIVIPKDQYDDDGEPIVPKTEEQLKKEHKQCNEKLASGAVSCIAVDACCYF
jgi:hypothetical protein